MEEYNSGLLEGQIQDQQDAMDYQEQLRQANAGYEDQKRTTLNDNAARGMTNSTGYSTAVGRDASGYNNTINSLNTQNTANIAAGNSRRALAGESFNRTLQAIIAKNAETQKANATSIGSNVTKPKPKPTPAPKPKPKPKPEPKPQPKPKPKGKK